MRTLRLWTKTLLLGFLAGLIYTPTAYGEPDSIQALLASNLEAYERLAAPMDPELQQDALGMREALLATTETGFADRLGEWLHTSRVTSVAQRQLVKSRERSQGFPLGKLRDPKSPHPTLPIRGC